MRKFIILVALVILMSIHLSSSAEMKTYQGSDFIKTSGAYPASTTSREMPATLGTTVYSTDIQFMSNCYTELSLIELYTGKEAERLAIEQDSFNKEPEEGMQYIIARFKVQFQAKDQNKYLMLFADHFKIVTGKGSVIKRDISSLVFGFNTEAQIYSGAETTIDVPLLVPISDDRLLLNYWNSWFLIREEQPLNNTNGL